MGRQPGALTLSQDDRRVLAVWAADCAERTLALFDAQAPNDTASWRLLHLGEGAAA
jgi:hypothetical protein